jgi:putative glutamine amidotransferase
MPSAQPIVGIPADRRILGHHPFHCVGEKYVTAVTGGVGALPWLIPSLGVQLDSEAGIDLQVIVDRVDGLLLTGSPSNVEPHHYQGLASAPGTWHDPHRDATTLPLIPLAVQAGVPILAICRGFQEMNVAFGGTLHQKLHEVPGLNDHRDDESQPLEVQYGPAHEVLLSSGGWFREWARAERITVNSLHSQGVNALGKGLAVEATAPDGVIEAFRVADAAFAVAVQWHPEWNFQSNYFSRALLAAFGAACRQRSQRK